MRIRKRLHRVVVAPGCSAVTAARGPSPAGDVCVTGGGASLRHYVGEPPTPHVVVAPARLKAHAVRFSRLGALLLFKTDKSLSVLTRTNLRGSEV